MAPTFQSFHDFYPFYLSEHRNPVCRGLHVAGSLGVLVSLFAILAMRAWAWLWLPPLLGYGLAWIGHFFFESNRPATFRHPLYSLAGDWMMLFQVLTGRISLHSKD